MSNFIDYLKSRKEQFEIVLILLVFIVYYIFLASYPSIEWIINNTVTYFALFFFPIFLTLVPFFILVFYRDYKEFKEEEKGV